MIYQSEGFPLNGIFVPCACLLAGGCGAWHLLARRRRQRHFVAVPLWGPPKSTKTTESTRYMLQNSRTCFSEGAESPEAITTSRTARGELPPWGNYHLGGTLNPVKCELVVDIVDIFKKVDFPYLFKIEMLEYVWEQFPHIQKHQILIKKMALALIG